VVQFSVTDRYSTDLLTVNVKVKSNLCTHSGTCSGPRSDKDCTSNTRINGRTKVNNA